MGIVNARVKNEVHQCESTAKSTGVRCQEYAWATYRGKYYCGHHWPYKEAGPMGR